MSPRLQFAVQAAYEAGRGTLAQFSSGIGFERKADDSPVTIADREAEAKLRKAIGETYPGDSILGEEEGLTGASSARWVLDPIDGTKSFICGVPLYGTLVAYEEDSETQLGVAYFPALDEMVYAERGKGCFWNGRACRVSAKVRIADAVLCTGSHASLRKTGRLEAVVGLGERAIATRGWCDAYAHALVATGRIEAMIDPVLSYWDIAAPKMIVTEAGGRFTDFKGNDNPTSEGLSSNGWLHHDLLEAFGERSQG
ncbi:MAG: histidinol phosphate phosphatase [Armatimonadetes bacterium]|nr:histidinol phosphate phosphatase [Armatimonadota bacterium]